MFLVADGVAARLHTVRSVGSHLVMRTLSITGPPRHERSWNRAGAELGLNLMLTHRKRPIGIY